MECLNYNNMENKKHPALFISDKTDRIYEENGELRWCSNNIAKMSVLEYVIEQQTNLKYYKKFLMNIFEYFKIGLIGCFQLFFSLLLLCTFPLSYLVSNITSGYFLIKRNIKEYNRYNN